jgi:hypothetical protein
MILKTSKEWKINRYKSDVMFVSKNIIVTSTREDVFGTLAQIKHSLVRRSRSCVKNVFSHSVRKSVLFHIFGIE